MERRVRAAVIAGTAVDTQMGVEYIEKRNREAGPDGIRIEPLYLPVSEDCDAQIRFQYSDEDGKRAVIDRLFDEALEAGAEAFFIYCNSLSGAFDFDIYALQKSMETGREIRVYTPLQVYRRLGREFSRIGFLAANNLSAHAIEEALTAGSSELYAIGSGNMALVRAIEDGMPPERIVRELGLEKLAAYMEACGAEALILGCTHFPYFRDELAKLCSVPLIDPADEMYGAMISAFI